MESLTTAQAARALGYLAALGLAFFFYRLYQVRMMFRRVKSQHGVVSLRSLSPAGERTDG